MNKPCKICRRYGAVGIEAGTCRLQLDLCHNCTDVNNAMLIVNKAVEVIHRLSKVHRERTKLVEEQRESKESIQLDQDINEFLTEHDE